jgi:hypothetical protein
MKKTILYLFAAVTLLSCSDFLDVEPDRQISINEQLGTVEGLDEAINGLYYNLEALISSKRYIYGDVMSGNTTFSPRISNRAVQVGNEVVNTYGFLDTALASDFEAFYRDCYTIVNQVNLVLERKDGFTYLSSERSIQLEAELLAIRALVHYELSLFYAQNYGFTPLATHAGIVYNTRTLRVGIDFPARDDMATTYRLLQADLERAIALMTSQPFLANSPAISVFNPINTKALYARIALQMNDWQLAANLADEVINTAGIQLTPRLNYLNEWTVAAPLSETLMEFTAPILVSGGASSSISQYYSYTSPTIYNRYVASGDLLASYDAGDLRLSLYDRQLLPTRIGSALVPIDYYFSRKYQRDSGTLFIRLSEMYLIHAEALQRETPGSTIALGRFNDIRERAGLVRSGAMNLDDILLERRREFAFENLYFYDLARFQKNIVRNQGCIAAVCNLSYPSPFYILPIPQPSIFANPNMIQNEGY